MPIIMNINRILRKVPKDFDWPLSKIWWGYICPISPPLCPKCKGDGVTNIYKNIEEEWKHEGIFSVDLEDVELILKDINLKEDLSIYLKKGEINNSPEKIQDYIFNECNKNTYSKYKFSHFFAEVQTKKLGCEKFCSLCKGEGKFFHNQTIQDIYNDDDNPWKVGPPEGDYYQLWETISEGSPLTPAFKTVEEVAEYTSKNGCGLSKDLSYDCWLQFLKNELDGYLDLGTGKLT